MNRLPPLALATLVVLAGLGTVIVQAPVTKAITAGAVSTFEPDGTQTSIAVGKPTGTTQGDLMMAHIIVRSTSVTVTPPTGWTLIRADSSAGGTASARVTAHLFRHFAEATEPTSYTWTFSTAVFNVGAIATYRGVDATTPIDVQTAANDNGNDHDADFPIVTTTQANDVVLVYASAEGDTKCETQSAAITTVAYKLNDGGDKITACHGSFTQAAAGATPVSDWDLKKAFDNVVHVIALKAPKVAFASASSSAAESSGSLNAQIALTGASSLATTVAFATTGTATVGASCTTGVDVIVSSTSPVSFGALQTTANVGFQLCDDAAFEGSETVIFTLSAPTNAILGTTTVYTFTILDNDLAYTIAADPVLATGVPDLGARWGGWAVDPGAAGPTSGNFLKLTHLGGTVPTSAVIDFSGSTFVGVTLSSETIPVDSNIQFACAQGTGVQVPQDLTFTFGATSATGSTTATFTTAGASVYCKYKLVAALANPLKDQAYQAAYTVT